MFSQFESILNFLMYLGITLPILILGLFVFMVTTPYNEYRLIREGAETSEPQKSRPPKQPLMIWAGKSSACRLSWPRPCIIR